MPDTIAVTFRCGHRQDVPVTVASPPACRVCGERVVARTTAPAPRFTGACRGPCVRQE